MGQQSNGCLEIKVFVHLCINQIRDDYLGNIKNDLYFLLYDLIS